MTWTPLEPNVVSQYFKQFSSFQLVKKGGYKAVYNAQIGTTSEALKIIQVPIATSADDAGSLQKELIGRIKRELAALETCACPELVKLGSALTEFQHGTQSYLVYSEEFLDGRDLWDLWRTDEATPSEKELKLLFGVLLRAIRKLWQNGYVHRDIKPSNIVKISDANRPFVLLDLGIAYSINDATLTANQQIVPATLRYIAPEMLKPNFRENLDYRSDLYTAALSVYEYGAKTHPFAKDADDAVKTISRAINDQPTPFHQVRPDISIEFCDVIDQLLKKMPALRPANLSSLIRLSE